jgi:hypothetical protein
MTHLVRHGKATVSWGSGPDTIIANAPVDSINDLVHAIDLARQRILQMAK